MKEKRQKQLTRKKLPAFPKFNYLSRLLFTSAGVTLALVFLLGQPGQKTISSKCLGLKLVTAQPEFLENKPDQKVCYQFSVMSNQILAIDTNIEFELLSSETKNPEKIMSPYNVNKPGNYTLRIPASKEKNSIKLQLIESTSLYQQGTRLPPVPTQPSVSQTDAFSKNSGSSSFQNSSFNKTSHLSAFSYNVSKQPDFYPNDKLQAVVDEVVNYIKSKKLPVEKLSVSLIKLAPQSKCCAYAAYLDTVQRFPASLTKLFWMVAFYGDSPQKQNLIPEEKLYKMIQDSSNESASQVVDILSDTESGNNLSSDELNKWINHRMEINRFFQKAGYGEINISQKNFPLQLHNRKPPEGRDLQMRGNEGNPIRNFVTSYQVARLLYEIETNQAISNGYSEKMKSLLKRDLRPQAWRNVQYNSIESFFGESLPENADFSTKVGWTGDSRQEAAIIGSPDGKTRYILVIIGDDVGFAQDWVLFPEISRLVYDRMLEYR